MAKINNKTKIGAAWKRKSGEGKSFVSGVVTIGGVETNILIFPNGYKSTDGPNAPDYIVYSTPPREKAPTQKQEPKQEAPAPEEEELFV